MNNKKKELINAIEEKMVVANVAEGERDDFLMGEPFIASLKWLPEENLQKMLACDLSQCTSFNEAYQAFGRNGAFRFQPYIVQNREDNPSLCIRRDRFLHMFRGNYFQVSGTESGIGDCGSGAYRMNFLTQTSYGEKIFTKGLISYMLWWAAMIDVGFGFDNFHKLFEKDRQVLDDFLDKSMSYWRVRRDQHWCDIDSYIEFSTGEIDKCKRTMYQLCDKANKIGVYFAMGKKTVQVQLSGQRLLTITIPDFNEGVEYDLEDEDDKDDYDSQVYVLEQNHYIEMITVMALALCGIKLSFINWYILFGKRSDLPPINAPGVTTVRSLNDIYKKKPDEF